MVAETGYVVGLPRRPAEVKPTAAQARDALGRNDIARAEDIARKLHAADPGDSDALVVLGLAARRRGDLSGAHAFLTQAAAAAPRNVEARGNLGLVEQDLGRLAQAEESFRAALAVDPNAPAVLFNLANLLAARDRRPEAIALCRRAIAAAPDLPQARVMLAVLLEQERQDDDAVDALRAAASFPAPVVASARQVAAKLAARGVRLPVAIWKLLAQTLPDDPLLRLRLGEALALDGSRAEALTALKGVRALPGATAQQIFESGNALGGLGEDQEAAAAYRSALAADPAHAAAHNNLAMLLFLDGNFEAAWGHHEWRFAAKGLSRPQLPGTGLTTPDIAGKTIFLHGEQGLGDNVQFLRYAKRLHDRGNRILVGVRDELVGLFRAQDYVDAVIGDGGTIPPFDHHCAMLSLPHVFRTSMDSIPADIPYLRVPGQTKAIWKARLAGARGPRIGVAWSGNPVHHNDPRRSISGSLFLATFEDLPVTLISLQKPWPDATARPAGMLDPGSDLGDLADTAAVIDELDLVIAVDTSPAHLAGALGRPLWLLLPSPCDWRWTRTGERTPWYPQARLFRQRTPGDWGEVLRRVRGELLALNAS